MLAVRDRRESRRERQPQYELRRRQAGAATVVLCELGRGHCCGCDKHSDQRAASTSPGASPGLVEETAEQLERASRKPRRGGDLDNDAILTSVITSCQS